jgi:hypothetical protein
MEADQRKFLLRRQLVLEDSSVGDVAHCLCVTFAPKVTEALHAKCKEKSEGVGCTVELIADSS